MVMGLLTKVFGTKSQRDVKRLRPAVAQINEIEEVLQDLSDEQLRAKTEEFKERLSNGETVDELMYEAFAVVKNACRRLCGTEITVTGHNLVWDMIPFDVQVMGGIVLHEGNIAEMATGEGKTLVATMPLYLNALTGRNCQLVTVSDYHALRDAEWMGVVYEYLGLTIIWTLLMEQIANTVLTTFEIWGWLQKKNNWCKEIITLLLLTKLTVYLLMKPEPH
jgi:preprotein translocase subunit SecA